LEGFEAAHGSLLFSRLWPIIQKRSSIRLQTSSRNGHWNFYLTTLSLFIPSPNGILDSKQRKSLSNLPARPCLYKPALTQHPQPLESSSLRAVLALISGKDYGI